MQGRLSLQCLPTTQPALPLLPFTTLAPPPGCSGDELDGELLAEVQQDDAVAKSQ